MIGNDIIDLAHARQESNWRRRGFLDKVFTPHEQRLIQSAGDPDVMVWTLWSMKESAYKLIVRETGQPFFAPQKLACHLINSLPEVAEGSVFYRKVYTTRSIITTQYVASVASSTDVAQFCSQVIISFNQADYQHQHYVLWDQLIRHYANRFSVHESQIRIQKNEVGVPTLVINGLSQKPQKRPMSLSHHGYYGAFVSLEPIG